MLVLPCVANADTYCNIGDTEPDIQTACVNGTAYNGGTILFADDIEDTTWCVSSETKPTGTPGKAYADNDGWDCTPYWFNDDNTQTDGTLGGGFSDARVPGYAECGSK